MCDINRTYRISNEEIRRRKWVENKLVGRLEKSAPRWFRNVERMARRVYDSGVERKRGRGRQTGV